MTGLGADPSRSPSHLSGGEVFGGEILLRVRGRRIAFLERMFGRGNRAKKNPAWSLDRAGFCVCMVAGVGFEPTTFRL
jgi:hypothetical protein